MSKQKSITPVEQHEIEFYNDRVIAVLDTDGTVYVPVKPICELIGVDWSGQLQRINRDSILSDLTTSVGVTPIDVQEGSDRPKTSHMIALPLSHLNGWLFGINANRVKSEIKPALLRYQRDCYNVLYEAFALNTVTSRHDDELLKSESPQGTAYRMALGIAKLAREQYYMGLKVENNTQRIGLIEARLNNSAAYVTQEQAQQISEGVKAIATVLSKNSKKNEYGGTYGELYRRYGVTSYKHIPASRFEQCMYWLRSWWAELTDNSDSPF